MNKHKELILIEELMVELIQLDEEDCSYFDDLQERQAELLELLEIE